MPTLVDLTFRSNYEYANAAQLMEAQNTALSYLNWLDPDVSAMVVKHASFRWTGTYHHTPFHLVKGKNHFFRLPITSCLLVKKSKAPIVLVQGLVFPVQVILLRWIAGKKIKILVQHHGEQISGGIKRFFQRWADRYVSAYLFTAAGNAGKWIEASVIRHPDYCLEVLEAASFFSRQNRAESIAGCGITGSENFLWVGRLNENKDPLTVINAFLRYAVIHKEAKLYMIYQSGELLEEMVKQIAQAGERGKNIVLKGKIPHEELPYWFSAADYYLSASHREGSGYALLEAMNCGCVPVVTDIPSFRKITGNGEAGYLYEPGNSEQLFQLLVSLASGPKKIGSEMVIQYANEHLSFRAIAKDISAICRRLLEE